MECPLCGKSIKDEDAVYCPYCSKPLRELPIKKTGLPIAGGVLGIIASCVSIITGTIFMIIFLISYDSGYLFLIRWNLLFAGLFGILAFSLGLTGGIMSLRRKHFLLAIIGIIFVLTGGFVNFLALTLEGYYLSWIGGIIFGFPIIVLSVLSLIFIAVSKGEFS